MTREEATTKLKWFLESNLIEDISGCEGLEEAIDMAIEALSNTFNTLSALDTIYRQAAIDAVETIGFDFSDSGLSAAEIEEVCEAIGEVRQEWSRRIKRLPSAQSGQKKGKWIEDRLVSTGGGTYGVRRCSECEAYYQDVGYGWNYCPSCGAKMEAER